MTTISQITSTASTINDADLTEIEQGGVSKQVREDVLKAYYTAGVLAALGAIDASQVVSGVLNIARIPSSVALKNIFNTFTKHQFVEPVDLVSAATVTSVATDSDKFKLLLANNATLDKPSGLVDRMILTYSIAQNVTGGWSLGLHADFVPWGGSPTTINTVADKNSLLIAEYRASTGKLYYNIVKEA